MASTATLNHDLRTGFMPSNPRNSMSIQNSKGLLNMPGQNNCFLNSAVQVLWHLDIFRRSFRDISGHACMTDSCIFCALKELFAQFQYSNESALPPDALRRALAETFFNQQRFQLGHMDDAAECFENILTRIHFHIAHSESEDMCNSLHCIPHQKFAMTLVEQSICHSCGATSEPLTFTQMVHYVSSSALCSQFSIMEREGKIDNNVFGHLLRKAGGMGDFRDCPSSCGAKIQICRTLINRPDIVSVGIVWDSDHPPLDHILDVFRAIGTSMQLQNVFHSVVDKRWGTSTCHQLVGVVTYYGKHYSTFFFHTKLKVWIYFDDATVREIGPRWEQVIEKCCRGHFQPLLLLYASPNGTPISMDGAPQTVTVVPNGNKIVPPSNKFTGMRQPSPKFNQTSRRSTTPSAGPDHKKNGINPEDIAKCHAQLMRQQSMDDILNSRIVNQDNFSTYISRKAVENILNQQKVQWQQQSPNSKLPFNSNTVGNRNSNSSLESFENALKMRMHGNDLRMDVTDGSSSLRRRDSGNWSGDRNSASSSSSTSQENPYFFLVGKKSPTKVHPSSPKRTDFPNILSDAGYDSFSLSSTDSFPSITSQGKYDLKLCQIPENPLSLINTDHFPPQGFADDCDRLCFEADQLLLLSQEKENDGDLAMALTLSDCAASKARAAMDAPYNNSKSIMAAKMKHSTCVMRSCSLHRRLAQEMKETKSTEGRHSRQSSKDSIKSNKSTKERSHKEPFEKQNKNSIDIYGTLPKKHSRRRCNSSGSSSEMKAAAIRASKEFGDVEQPTQEVYVKRTVRDVKQENKHKKLNREEGGKYKEHKKQLLDGYLSVDAADYSDHYNEWEDCKKAALSRSHSGSQAVKSNKSKDDLNQSCNVPDNKKQHKVRRKLLMGGLIRRKNRSMPDLTDANDEESFEDFKGSKSLRKVGSTFHSEVDSAIHSRGFLQPHPAFMRSNKLPQPNRLPPPPPVRVPVNKLKLSESPLTLKKNSSSLPKLSTFSTYESGQSKFPVDHPEYMNLQNVQRTIHRNRGSENSSPIMREPSPAPQYMNTIDYMNMCRPSSNPQLESFGQPEYMNLQYLRDVQNVDSLRTSPLPPPPSPQSVAPAFDDLPLPPPPSEEVLSNSIDEPDCKVLSPFLLELKAKKEELEKKASEKSAADEVPEDQVAKKSSWLEELQFKQKKMLQKKGSEQKKTDTVAENSSERMPSPVVSNERIQLKKITKSEESRISGGSEPSSHPSTKDGSIRSVRDLASRFENILKTPFECPSPEPTRSVTPQSDPKFTEETKRVSQNLDEKIKNLKSPAMRRKSQNANVENHVAPPVKSVEAVTNPREPKNAVLETPSVTYYEDFTETEHEEIARKTNENTQNNAIINDGFSRPMQPPDYETAIKRKGEINNNSLERQDKMIIRKRHPSRRSVTFSDQVVLVACANDNEEEYMPHPLLEKAFRQHNAENNDKKPSTVTEIKPLCCDLCHNQPVVPSELYCSNCSFYMSRFRPKS